MPAEFLADESVDSRIVVALREDGIPISSVREECPGASDRNVLEMSVREGRVLLTEDSDFGAWVFAHHAESIGVIFLRYRHEQVRRISEIVLDLITRLGDSLSGKFVTITTKKIRIREI